MCDFGEDTRKYLHHMQSLDRLDVFETARLLCDNYFTGTIDINNHGFIKSSDH